MRKTKLAASLLAVSFAATTLLTGCNKPGETSTSSGTTSGPASSGPFALNYAAGTTLRMAVGYNSSQTGLFFDGKTVGDKYEKVQEIKDGKPQFNEDGTPKMVDDTSKVVEKGKIKLADEVEYVTGDLKPTWVEIEKQLNVKFENKYQGNSASKEWDAWEQRLGEVDFVSGTAATLTAKGSNSLVNLSNYMDAMPNFKAYLDKNPIVRLSITGSTSGDNVGAIYFSPYFDGVNDIERMPLMRTDWVEKLLNGTEPFTAEKSGNTATPVYKPYMPTAGSVKVDVVKADGSATEQVTKNYDAFGNIIDKMNAPMTGVEAVNMLREYIDKTYGGYYTPENRADLFIGQNAAWDADELVALLRCVVANAPTLNGDKPICGLFSREDNNNQRRVDMMRFAGVLFGVRGLESRSEYFYVDKDGNLQDARMQPATYEAMERMNCLAQEGLLSASFIDGSKEKTETMLENDLGFMHYDYNQTQTVFNNTKLQEGEKYMAVMVPVAKWDDGVDSTPDYFRFTESWRSVKTDGWGISKAGVGLTDDKAIHTQEEFDALPDKLKACLKLIDYAYTDMGMVLLSYGPDAFIDVKNPEGTTITERYNTFNFNGEEMPKIAQKTYDELWSKAGGNYTNYARRYLGSTLSFVKSQAFEYQCTTEVGKEGAGYISKAIALGTIKHPVLDIADDSWYTSVPTVLPTTDTEKTGLDDCGIAKSDGVFSTSKDKSNVLVDIIRKGYGVEKTETANYADSAAVIKAVTDDLKGTTYMEIKNAQWQRLVAYYDTLYKA